MPFSFEIRQRTQTDNVKQAELEQKDPCNVLNRLQTHTMDIKKDGNVICKKKSFQPEILKRTISYLFI